MACSIFYAHTNIEVFQKEQRDQGECMHAFILRFISISDGPEIFCYVSFINSSSGKTDFTIMERVILFSRTITRSDC